MKFSLKDVEWRYEDYEHLGVRVWHLPTDVQCFVNDKKSNTHALFLALKSLEEKVNEHYQKIEDSYVDIQMPLKTNEDFLDEMDKIEIRTKALELACSLYSTTFYEKDRPLVDVAKIFCAYIIKGE